MHLNQPSHPQSVGKLSFTKTVSDAKNVGDNLLAGFAPSLSCLLGPNRYPAKKCSNYCTIALISHASKVMLKIFQARVQQYMNRELPDVQVGFRKSRGIRDPINNICWIIKKARKFQKNTCFCFTDYVKAFDCVDRDKLWNILKRGGNTRSPDLPPEKSVCRSKSNS